MSSFSVGAECQFLSEEHLIDLYASGLTDETIHQAGLETVDDPQRIADLLNMPPHLAARLGPCLTFPYFGLDGKPTDYVTIKPTYPRQEGIKYEIPWRVPTRPYFPPAAISAINTPKSLLLITEGQKKALASTQAGIPSIALSGVVGWSQKRKENHDGRKGGQRRLNKWLREIDWQSRKVFIVFDTDDKRNPDVNREAAELARVLETHGATVHILTLPLYLNEFGEYEKQGLDDFLVQHGREALQGLIDTKTAVPSVVGLDEFRGSMLRRREEISEPGLYLDASPPGLGKSYLDTQTALHGGKMLVLVPTHRQCESAIAQFAEQNIEAVKFPERSGLNCGQYPQIRKIESVGLNASSIFCPRCQERANCEYHRLCHRATSAKITVATHARFHQGCKKLARGRMRISVHEDTINFLAPVIKADDFEQMIALGQWALNPDKSYLEAAANFLEVAEFCCDALQQFDETVELQIPVIENLAENIGQHLNRIAADIVYKKGVIAQVFLPRVLQQPLNGQAFRLCQLLLTGQIRRLCVQCAVQNNGYITKSIVGIQRTDLPPDAVVILNDGTATLESIPAEFQQRLRSVTPTEQIEQLQSVVQYPVDITKSDGSLFRLARYIRAILHQHPDKRRIGLITPQTVHYRPPRAMSDPRVAWR